ncbi:hypothetical protein ACIBCO_39185 [Streptomyces violascens]|uniref:hypothetical protein n=1 Tax=Streptomyces violascens TaxID=67381 RepID=UPI003792DA3F
MTTKEIEDRLDKVEKELAQKANKAAEVQNTPSVNWTDWKVNWSKWFEIIAVTKVTSILSFGLPKLFNFDGLLEKRFKLERNKWGFLWKKAANPLDAQVIRIDTLEDLQRQSNSHLLSLARIVNDNVIPRVRQLENRQQGVRQQVRTGEAARRPIAPVNGDNAARIHDLELRVTNLARALG